LNQKRQKKLQNVQIFIKNLSEIKSIGWGENANIIFSKTSQRDPKKIKIAIFPKINSNNRQLRKLSQNDGKLNEKDSKNESKFKKEMRGKCSKIEILKKRIQSLMIILKFT